MFSEADVMINSTTVILSRSHVVYESTSVLTCPFPHAVASYVSTLHSDGYVIRSETNTRVESDILLLFLYIHCFHAHHIKHCFDFTANAQEGFLSVTYNTQYT